MAWKIVQGNRARGNQEAEGLKRHSGLWLLSLSHLYSNKTLLMCPSENGRNSINSVNYIVTSGDNAILLSAISTWFKSNICSSFPKYITTTLRCVFRQNLCVFVATNCTEHCDNNSTKEMHWNISQLIWKSLKGLQHGVLAKMSSIPT